MKVALFSKNKIGEELKKELQNHGFQYNESKPEIVICIGGDGTFLRAERKWPGVPKAIVRKSSICKKCNTDSLEELIKQIKEKKMAIIKNIKLETKIRRKRITCTNEFSIRNRYATTALRFYVWINGKKTEEIIGDGVVICTPFGSTGYYKSVGGESFEKGIGIGFNNPTEKMKSIVVPENSIIEVKINRGDAVFNSDNDPQVVILDKNEIIKIKKSQDTANIIQFQ